MQDKSTMTMEEKDQLKLERLQSTLNRAYKNVPFHRNRFTERSLLPEDIISLKDLEKLPFMDDDVLTLVEKHLEGQATPPRAINPQIPEQTVANLLARWDTEAIKTRVGFEEKAAVIRSNAKAQVQQDTVYSLRDMLLTSNQAKTAMILRIFQALEAATMDSDNKELTNMIKMLGDIRKWFNISQIDGGENR